MATQHFIDKLNEYNEWHKIPRANEYIPCPVVFEDLDCSNFPVHQYTTYFISVIFKNCNFNRSEFTACVFMNCTFENCTFNHTVFRYNQIIDCEFCNCDLSKCNFKYSDCWANFDIKCIFDKNTFFTLCSLAGSRIDADFTAVHFTNCILQSFQGHKESLNKHIPLACPAEGEFIGWKKVYSNGTQHFLAKLLIPEDAKRLSAHSSKCRCNKATVLEITTLDGTPCPDDFVAFSHYDKKFTYKKNDTLIINNFDEDRWNECSTGIHFFMNKEEAIEY